MVLRRPPYGAKSLKGGHDMLREYTVLKNLTSQFHKVPNVHLYCDDENILGAPFYIMDRVEGYIIRPNLQQKNSPSKKIIEKICQEPKCHICTIILQSVLLTTILKSIRFTTICTHNEQQLFDFFNKLQNGLMWE